MPLENVARWSVNSAGPLALPRRQLSSGEVKGQLGGRLTPTAGTWCGMQGEALSQTMREPSSGRRESHVRNEPGEGCGLRTVILLPQHGGLTFFLFKS